VSDYYIGEIRLFSFSWAPRDWALCNGALLQVQQNQALFSVLGKQYGGDGVQTFALPDLRGRVPVGMYCGATNPKGFALYNTAQTAGVEGVALTSAQYPLHAHAVRVNTSVGTTSNPTGAYFAAVPDVGTPAIAHPIFAFSASGSDVLLESSTLSVSGGSAAHNNMQPFAVMNFCIATAGLYPPRQ